MAFNIGVNVVEVEGRAAATIVAAPVSIAGLLVRSARGVPNVPVHVLGFTDFAANFGGYVKGLYSAHALRGFFENGGSEAYAIRVVGSGALAASATLNNAAAAGVLTVNAGMRGQADPGQWGNALSVVTLDHPRGTSSVPAQILGSAAEPFALADMQTLVVTVNGGAPAVTVTFHAANFAAIGAATAAEVAAAINRSTTAFRAGVTANRHLLLSSATPGAASRLAVAGTAAVTLGFTAATANSDPGVTGATVLAIQSTGGFLPGSAVRVETRGFVLAPLGLTLPIVDNSGINVQADGGAVVPVKFKAADFQGGLAAATPAELVAAINRQANGFSAALAYNGRLTIFSSSFGPGSSILLTAGAPDATAAIGFTGNVPVAGSRVFRAVSAVSESGKFVTVGAALPATAVNAARLQSVEFDILVKQNGAEVERFESLSMEASLDYYAATVLNHQDTGSRYITVTDLLVLGPGVNAPAPAQTTLTLGNDGNAPVDNDYIGDPAARTGLYGFDLRRIQLLACPETTSIGVAAAAIAYCEGRGDAMFVGTAPQGYDLDGIKTYASALRAKKVYGALYSPWISIVNPLDLTGADPRLTIPPVGHVLGAYARIADARGVWKAPAGDEANLRNALGVELDMTDTDETDLVKNGGVNAIRAIPGSGIIVDTSRTLSTDTRWLFVNVRRLFNFVKSSLRDGLRWVSQEPHSEELRRAVRLNVVTPFLLGLWRQGAFGSDPADKVFTVKCDAQNNPPSEVNLGNFKIEVYFYPVKPAETIIIMVGQQESGAAAKES